MQSIVLTSAVVLCKGLQRKRGSPASGEFGDIAGWYWSTEEQSLVPRAPSHRIPMVLHFRHLGSPGDICQCLETILVTTYRGVKKTCWHLVSGTQRCCLSTHKTDPVAKCYLSPNDNSVEDGQSHLDLRGQSNGEFSKAPKSCMSHLWVRANQQ